MKSALKVPIAFKAQEEGPQTPPRYTAGPGNRVGLEHEKVDLSYQALVALAKNITFMFNGKIAAH